MVSGRDQDVIERPTGWVKRLQMVPVQSFQGTQDLLLESVELSLGLGGEKLGFEQGSQ